MSGLPSAKGYWPPGLVSRDIVDSDDVTVTIREVWDPRVPGCPLLMFDKTTWPWTIRKDVESVTHTFKCPHYGDRPVMTDGEGK